MREVIPGGSDRACGLAAGSTGGGGVDLGAEAIRAQRWHSGNSDLLPGALLGHRVYDLALGFTDESCGLAATRSDGVESTIAAYVGDEVYCSGLS